jgi:hypothetical protein
MAEGLPPSHSITSKVGHQTLSAPTAPRKGLMPVGIVETESLYDETENAKFRFQAVRCGVGCLAPGVASRTSVGATTGHFISVQAPGQV